MLARRRISKRTVFTGWFRGTCQYVVATIDTYVWHFQRSYSTRYALVCPRNHLNRMPNLLFPLHTMPRSLSVCVFGPFSTPCHFPLRSPCSLSSPPIHVGIFNVHFSNEIYTTTYLSSWSFLYSLCSCLWPFPLRCFRLSSSIHVTYVLIYIFLLKFIHRLICRLGHFYILSVCAFGYFSFPCHFPLPSCCSLSSPPMHVGIFNVHQIICQVGHFYRIKNGKDRWNYTIIIFICAPWLLAPDSFRLYLHLQYITFSYLIY